MKKIPMAILVVALIAFTVIERKKAKGAQEKARRILFPNETISTELRSHEDPESQTLARQLEDRLQRRGNRQRK